MKPHHEAECAVRIDCRALVKPTVQKKRLGDEQDKSENHPDPDHGMHPPEGRIEKAVKCRQPPRHVETRKTGNGRRDSRLPAEAALDDLKHPQTLGSLSQAIDGGQDNSGHHGHAANPMDDGENVEGARDSKVVHYWARSNNCHFPHRRRMERACQN